MVSLVVQAPLDTPGRHEGNLFIVRLAKPMVCILMMARLDRDLMITARTLGASAEGPRARDTRGSDDTTNYVPVVTMSPWVTPECVRPYG